MLPHRHFSVNALRVLLLFVVAVSVVRAGSVSVGSASLIWTFDGNDVTLTWSVPGPATPTSYYMVGFWQADNASGAGETQVTIKNGYFGPLNGSQTFTLSKGYFFAGAYQLEPGSNIELGAQRYGWAPVDEVPEVYKQRLHVQNQAAWPVNYRVLHDGQVIDTFSLSGITVSNPNGEEFEKVYTLPNANSISVEYSVPGFREDGPVWVAVGVEEDPVWTGGVGPLDDVMLLPIDEEPPPYDLPLIVIDVPGAPPTSSQEKGVWESINPTSSGNGLTGKQYAEGVDKIVSAIKNSQKADNSGIETRLDTANEHLEILSESQKARDAEPNQGALQSAAAATFQTAATGVQAEFQAEWASKVGNFSLGSTTVPSGGGDWPSIDFPILGTINFSPSSLPWLLPFLHAAREVVLWLLVAAFIQTGLRMVTEYSLQVATVPQVNTTVAAQDMVPVAGQAVSWLKGTITATAIVSFVVVAYGAAIGVVNTGISMAGLSSTVASFTNAGAAFVDKLGSTASNPLWGLVLDFFPLGAFISLIVAEIGLYLFMAPIFLGASFIVRAIRA